MNEPKPEPDTALVAALNAALSEHREGRLSQAIETYRLILLCHPKQLVSLQREIRELDLPILANVPVIQRFGEEVTDFADAAALISELDLVVSVDTSLAPLAGALGKPVWIFLPYVADWRWLQNREDSPWYPSARPFRQSRPRDWASVLERVAAELYTALVRADRYTRLCWIPS
jgi:hypothetical protein